MYAQPKARGRGILAYFGNRAAKNAKKRLDLSAAEPLDHHSAANHGIERNFKHYSDTSMAISDME